MSEDDDRIQEMVEAQHEDSTPDEDEGEGFEMQIAVPNLEDDAPPLTDVQIKFGLANHALCMQQLIRVINAQEESITTLLYIMATYMKQYPLDISSLAATEEQKERPAPAPTGQYL